MKVTAPVLSGMIASGLRAVAEILPEAIHEVTLHGLSAIVYVDTPHGLFRVRVDGPTAFPSTPPRQPGDEREGAPGA